MKSSATQTVPFWTAVIVNMNAILGAGVFINTGTLINLAGPWCVISYLAMAFLVLPLVLSIAQLAAVHEATYGGLYQYAKEQMGKAAGVFCGVSYIFAKTSSMAALAFASSIYLRSLIPSLPFILFIRLQ